MYSKILVPIDGSPLSDRAIKEAVKLSRELGATLTLFHVVPTYRMPAPNFEGSRLREVITPELYKRNMQAHAKHLLAAATKKTGIKAVRSDFAYSDQPYEAIIAAARKHRCSLVVMASHGRRGLKGLLLGSETHKVLTHSSIPVLVVR